MSNLPSVKMAPERITQLRQMQSNMGATNMSEVIAKLIEFAQNQGLVDHEIPGVKINAFSDGLAIKFDDGETVGFSHVEAARLVSEIRAFLSGDRDNQHVVSLSAKQANFGLKGRGQGVAISIPAFSKSPKIFDRGLADEFARLVERCLPETQ